MAMRVGQRGSARRADCRAFNGLAALRAEAGGLRSYCGAAARATHSPIRLATVARSAALATSPDASVIAALPSALFEAEPA